MKLWCIHGRRSSTGEQVKVQVHGPDDPRIMLQIAMELVAENDPDIVIEMLHEEVEDDLIPLPKFERAIENMAFQGYLTVQFIMFIARYLHHKKEH